MKDKSSLTSEKISKLKKIISFLYTQMDEAVEIKILLDAGNTQETEKLFENKPQTYVMNVIRKALFERLTLTLMRMHDGAGVDKACLPQVFALISESEVFNLLHEKTSDSGISIGCLLNENWPVPKKGKGKTWLKTLRDYRNDTIAHNLLFVPEKQQPLYNHVFNLLKESSFLIEELASALKVINITFNTADSIRKERVEAYWSMVTKGMK